VSTTAQARAETRREVMVRWEREGYIDPACRTCRKMFYESDRHPFDVTGPRHTPSRFCASGKRPHCACDACF
jgi:hypothetical protein